MVNIPLTKTISSLKLYLDGSRIATFSHQMVRVLTK